MTDKFIHYSQLENDKDYATQLKLCELEETITSNIMRIEKIEGFIKKKSCDNIESCESTKPSSCEKQKPSSCEEPKPISCEKPLPTQDKPLHYSQEKESSKTFLFKTYDKILLIGDSHTRDMQNILNQNIPATCRAKVICLPGKTLNNVVNTIKPHG